MAGRNLVFLIAMLAVATQAKATPQYSITDLGMHGRTAYGARLNNNGKVTFSVHPESPNVPGLALLADGSGITNLGGLGGTTSTAGEINDSGRIAGYAELPGGTLQSYVYQNGQLTSLGSIGTRGNIAGGVNQLGHIVGNAFYDDGQRGFAFYSSDNILDLGTLGGNLSSASDINDLGQIVGTSTAIHNGPPIAFLYENGAMVNLGTLGGTWSGASAINNNSIIVGSSATNIGEEHAALFLVAALPVDLGVDGTRSSAAAINDIGVIVGSMEVEPGKPRAALFSMTDGPVLLQDLLPPTSKWDYLFQATGINNHGQIVGTGIFNNQPGLRAFLMTPIPEPSSIALILPAAVLLPRYFRKTQRTASPAPC